MVPDIALVTEDQVIWPWLIFFYVDVTRTGSMDSPSVSLIRHTRILYICIYFMEPLENCIITSSYFTWYWKHLNFSQRTPSIVVTSLSFLCVGHHMNCSTERRQAVFQVNSLLQQFSAFSMMTIWWSSLVNFNFIT